MSRVTHQIKIKLTEEQIEKLRELFDMMGPERELSLIAQVDENRYGSPHMIVGFCDKETTDRVRRATEVQSGE